MVLPLLQMRVLRLERVINCPKVTQWWVPHYLPLREDTELVDGSCSICLGLFKWSPFSKHQGDSLRKCGKHAMDTAGHSMSQSRSGKLTIIDINQLLMTVSLYLQSQFHRPRTWSVSRAYHCYMIFTPGSCFFLCPTPGAFTVTDWSLSHMSLIACTNLPELRDSVHTLLHKCNAHSQGNKVTYHLGHWSLLIWFPIKTMKHT